MKRSLNELFTERLKGGIALLLIVFAVLVLAGGPSGSTAETGGVVETIVVDPANRA